MPIQLDFSLNSLEAKKISTVDPKSISQTDIDYYLFCGSIVFRIDGATFDAPWEWVPVLGFASQLAEIVELLVVQESASLGFTESDASISFRRNGSTVRIDANYCSSTTEISLVELTTSANEFMQRVARKLIESWPLLEQCWIIREMCRFDTNRGGRDEGRST